MRYIGIDPGQSGALAYISNRKAEAVPVPLHPQEDRKAWGSPIDWLSVYTTLKKWAAPGAVAIIEQVHAMPGQGVSSMFRFGGNYTGLLTVCQVLQLDYVLVVPRTWKKVVLGTDFGHDKQGAIDFCSTRWPNLSLLATKRSRVPHDGMADALCLAAYGEEVNTWC